MNAIGPGSVRKARACSGGFTLLEMLLAMLLVSMIMALAHEGMRTAVRGTERGHAHIQAAAEVRAVQDFLRGRLARALSRRVDLDGAGGPEQPFVFRGDGGRMRFVAPMPGYLTEGGLYLITLELVQEGEKASLQLRHRLLADRYPDGATEPPPAGEPERLLDDIREARFSYQYRDEDGRYRWTDRWGEDFDRRLPSLVRIRIERTRGARVDWPELAVGPGRVEQGG